MADVDGADVTGTERVRQDGSQETTQEASIETELAQPAEDEQSDQPAAGTFQARQWNKHDVKRLEQECERLRVAMLQTGYQMNIPAIRDGAMAFAACRLLVTKGLVSEDELNGEVLSHMRQILMHGLQQAEEARLAAEKQQRGLAVAQRPNLVVAKH